jgi:DNA-binding GntR family transcriptional regulator
MTAVLTREADPRVCTAAVPARGRIGHIFVPGVMCNHDPVNAPGEPAAERAYRLLRSDILSGVLPGGSRLGETNLAEMYGFSRTPVRESLRRLQSEGLVEVSPHRGARIVDWRSLDIASISELRALVEGYVVRAATKVITSKDIAELSLLCDEMEQLTARLGDGDVSVLDRLAEVNVSFHNEIALTAGGDRMVKVRNAVLVMPLVYRTVHDFQLHERQRSNQHHRELLTAFDAHDADWAEAVMSAHVHAAKVRLIRDQQLWVAGTEASGPEK